MKKELPVKVGIWDTHLSYIQHKHGPVTLIVPRVKWTNNSGTLDFTKCLFEGAEDVAYIKQCFADKIRDVNGLFDLCLNNTNTY